jgi:S1-C subfamily serine protease
MSVPAFDGGKKVEDSSPAGLADATSDPLVLSIPQTSPAGLHVVDYSAPPQNDNQTHDPWSKALHRVIKAIVSIRAKALRTFDLQAAGTYEGTGFVVDKKNGIILSNRHLVTQGPISATAIFGNYEEIILRQDYTDPVHDFGFFRYDPAKVKFAEVEEIELYPQGARVGLDIKICGNDAGEKLSILGGTLARLDRDAPRYDGGYLDFNINYFQAASGTSGGSSGSPVLDIQGRAIALNAGGSNSAASSFFLPLEPVVRALKYIQTGETIPRGTIQTVFSHSSYDDLKRSAFPESAEKDCRERNKPGTGLLTIAQILPNGPGYESGIEVGDAIIEVYEKSFGTRFVDGFHTLWDVIDGSIGKEITLILYRAEERKEISVVVQDLQSLVPTTFVEVCGGIFHPLSYQLAMAYHMPCTGVYAVSPGQFRWGIGAADFIITLLNGRPVKSIEAFTEIILALPDRARVGFRYKSLGGRSELYGIVEIDHHFGPSAIYNRHASAKWERKLLPLNPQVDQKILRRNPTFDFNETRSEMLKNILVTVDCRVPYPIEVNCISRKSNICRERVRLPSTRELELSLRPVRHPLSLRLVRLLLLPSAIYLSPSENAILLPGCYILVSSQF